LDAMHIVCDTDDLILRRAATQSEATRKTSLDNDIGIPFACYRSVNIFRDAIWLQPHVKQTVEQSRLNAINLKGAVLRPFALPTSHSCRKFDALGHRNGLYGSLRIFLF
ncbi:MAG: hypothetical protein P8I83_04155, partial [Paracoccaceae bacterium]|nr:hypothetical protein [Paracoccaceae bacterium]